MKRRHALDVTEVIPHHGAVGMRTSQDRKTNPHPGGHLWVNHGQLHAYHPPYPTTHGSWTPVGGPVGGGVQFTEHNSPTGTTLRLLMAIWTGRGQIWRSPRMGGNCKDWCKKEIEGSLIIHKAPREKTTRNQNAQQKALQPTVKHPNNPLSGQFCFSRHPWGPWDCPSSGVNCIWKIFQLFFGWWRRLEK